jgi:hypothetical protein
MTALQYHQTKRKYWFNEFKELSRQRHKFKTDTYHSMVKTAKKRYKEHRAYEKELEELYECLSKISKS